MRAFDEGEALFGRCLQLTMDENSAPFLVSFSFIIWIQPEKYAAVFLKLQITSKQNLLNNSSRWLIIIHIMAETPPSMLFPVVPSKSLCFPPDFYTTPLISPPTYSLLRPFCLSSLSITRLIQAIIQLQSLFPMITDCGVQLIFCETDFMSICWRKAGSHPATHRHVCACTGQERDILYYIF